jgi:hypothetical protein
MLFGETVAAYCDNHTEHTDTLWAARTSQETHYVSATETNRLMFRERAAISSDNHTEHIDALWSTRTSQETLRLRCRAQPINAV